MWDSHSFPWFVTISANIEGFSNTNRRYNPDPEMVMFAVVLAFDKFKLCNFGANKQEEHQSMSSDQKQLGFEIGADGGIVEKGKSKKRKLRDLGSMDEVIVALNNLEAHLKLCHDRTWVTMMFHEAREHLTELMNAVGESDTPTLSYWVEKCMSSTRRLFVDHVRKELPFNTFRFFGGVEGQKKLSEEALLKFTKRATASMRSLMMASGGGDPRTRNRSPPPDVTLHRRAAPSRSGETQR